MSALLRYPLSGMHLIEASAGTGKTYAISGLFVRLLLEKKLAVRQILVVTYTRAATEDLRLRVRQMVGSCLQAFASGRGRDDFETGLLAEIDDHDQAGRRLVSALQDFDEAAIFTIHAFCQRMLKENSLESGALMDTELVPDLDELLQEIAADFWRLQMDRFPPAFTALAAKKILPDRLFFFVKKMRPGLLLLPAIDPAVLERIAGGGLAGTENEVSRALAAVCRAWPLAREQVHRLLLENTGLNKKSYSPEKIPLWLAEMDAFCREQPVYQGVIPENFGKFSADSLAAATKKNSLAPVHPFFHLCREVCVCHEKWTTLCDQGLIALRQEAARYGLAEFDRRKREKNLFAYDDLLHKLRQALQGQNRDRLIRRILDRFPAALIDEFQDTDPVQYEIFSTLYQCAAQTLLYIIGDPKQAIYSFRGADIFTYMTAIRDVPSSFDLDRNYRSEPGLIRAVNSLFAAATDPFVYSRIPFHPVSAADKKERPLLTIGGRQEPPLQLWQIMRRPAENDAMPREVAEKRVLAALAAEISGLLEQGRNGEALIGDRRLGPRDIAVLVRENREAQQVQKILYRVGIPSVQQSMEDLFATHETEELSRVLSAVVEPANDRKIRAALATDMLGGTCVDLLRLEEDEEAWSSRLALFLFCHHCWREKGFMAMFRLLLDQQHVRVQLLRFVDGERRLTNVLHLGEVLHSHEREKKATPAALLAWLADRIAGRDKAAEEHQLRLESDAERVQIVTIHRAKGLQYPVVFCPFSWGGSRSIRETVSFHLPEGGNVAALDMGSEEIEQHKEMARQEELAENMRLLYVALTRAVHRCYVAWGAFHGAESSALAWLFHGRGDFAALKKRVKKLTDAEIGAELIELVRQAEGNIALVARTGDELPSPRTSWRDRPAPLVCRTFTGGISALQVTSFTAITSHGRHGEPFAPREEARGAPEDSGSIHAFPRGAAPGTFMHDIFEHLDFPQLGTDPETCRQLIVKKLARHGFAPSWQDAVFAMVHNVLTTPLLPDRPELVLQSVAAGKRLNELEFYFPLAAVTSAEVKEILQAHGHGGPLAAALEFTVNRGFLKGYIDLVFERDGRFYLVDWKSNYLGAGPADYNRGRLEEVMVRERYSLQYLFYTVALHQYLAQRLTDYSYETHFGGCFYIFLRGVHPEYGSACGIYHDRPAADLVTRLSRLLVAS